MNATMMVAGYLWTGIICLVLAAICLDYARRWWKGRQDAKRMERRVRNIMRVIASNPPFLDFPRPMGVKPLEKGWIAESRYTVYADSEADVIKKLIGEVE